MEYTNKNTNNICNTAGKHPCGLNPQSLLESRERLFESLAKTEYIYYRAPNRHSSSSSEFAILKPYHRIFNPSF